MSYSPLRADYLPPPSLLRAVSNRRELKPKVCIGRLAFKPFVHPKPATAPCTTGGVAFARFNAGIVSDGRESTGAPDGRNCPSGTKFVWGIACPRKLAKLAMFVNTASHIPDHHVLTVTVIFEVRPAMSGVMRRGDGGLSSPFQH